MWIVDFFFSYPDSILSRLPVPSEQSSLEGYFRGMLTDGHAPWPAIIGR